MSTNRTDLVNINDLAPDKYVVESTVSHKGALVRTLCTTHLVSFLSNFTSWGDWRTKLILYIVSLLSLVITLVASLHVAYAINGGAKSLNGLGSSEK